MNETDIRAQMSARSTEELIRITKYEAADYTDAAFEAAHAELVTRNVTDADQETARNQQESAARSQMAEADAPLSWSARIGLALFPISILFYVVVIEGFRQRGQRRKAREAMVIMMIWPTLLGVAGLIALVRVLLGQ